VGDFQVAIRVKQQSRKNSGADLLIEINMSFVVCVKKMW